MKIKKLPWDSAFFGKEIGEVFLEKKEGFLLDNALDFQVIYLKEKEDFGSNIPYFTKTYTETKINFIKKGLVYNENNFSEVKDTDLNPKNWEFFRKLGYESGNYSRFLLDKKFGEASFKKLYNEWIINSLNKKFAEKIFYIEQENTAIGFVTLQKTEKKGKIGLIAVHKEFQGKKIGKKLLQYTENYCMDHQMQSLEIPTQRQNIQACQFYITMGYAIKEEEIISHFWRNNNKENHPL